MLLTAAAYLFHNMQTFRKVILALVLNHHRPYFALYLLEE
ncbi:hypothetical protein FOCG_03627 [Fusarium oxysporum f. sp. radicis-lycopersici 26381]|nr:hypothetical protein FOWG_16819 [Fusarium oxysporum f. sp. lycopersici MN25]EXL55906.1 hypothetical protein FOCG_03627 [Fusarium oxysporum f. sp. radicis-lycopersici 26381]